MISFLTFRPFTGRHVVALAVLFFGTIITVNITMATLATQTWTGLMAKNGYVASLDFAAEERAKSVLAERGWTVSVHANGGLVSLQLADADGALAADTVRVEAVPVASNEPHPVEMAALGAGHYLARAPLPAGEWMVRANIVVAGETVSRRVRIAVE